MSLGANIVNAVCFCIDFTMWSIIVIKVRCCNHNADDTDQFELHGSTELMIHSYYIISILWHIGQFCWEGDLSIAGWADNENMFCRASITATMTLAMLYQISLHNILTNRLYYAFKDTEEELSKRSHRLIRFVIIFVWVGMFCFCILFVWPKLFAKKDTMYFFRDGHCIDYSSAVTQLLLPIVSAMIALSIMGTMGIVGIFIWKLTRFRTSIVLNDANPLGAAPGTDADFLWVIVKKQSVIMCWIAMTSVVLIAVNIVFLPYVEGIPLLIDYTANGIAIFLSFSFNSSWYKWCQCHRCADWLFVVFHCLSNCSCPRIRRKGQIQRNLEITINLEIQTVSHQSDTQVNQQDNDNIEKDNVPNVPLQIEMVGGSSKQTDNELKFCRQKSQGLVQMMRNTAISESKLSVITAEDQFRTEDSNKSSIQCPHCHERTQSSLNAVSGMLKEELERNIENEKQEAKPMDIELGNIHRHQNSASCPEDDTSSTSLDSDLSTAL